MTFFVFISLVLNQNLALGKPYSQGADLVSLELTVVPDFSAKSIRVTCRQDWETFSGQKELRLLFRNNMRIDSLLLNGEPARYTRDSLSITVSLKDASFHTLRIVYEGVPKEAINPPWQGGFIWTKDPESGLPWLTMACQHEGAEIWWPAPEQYSEKPDKVKVTCIYPRNLFFKGNGNLLKDEVKGARRYTTWGVSYPIHPYNIVLNIGNYGHFSDTLVRRDGTLLRLDYYPLKSNLAKARKQFVQVKPMLDCYEMNFGNYPYERDGFSVVETPFAGMEHQSAIAYGNGYTDGYLGQDYSAINLDFDFILIHESAHEWWGNAISARNREDFWLQEAFCTFAEYNYVQCRYGDVTAVNYINAKKRLVKNQAPVLSNGGSGTDMYTKGALMLYTLKTLVDNDARWKEMLFRFSMQFRYSSISTSELIDWFSRETGRNLKGFFSQFLERADIPQLEIKEEVSKDGMPETRYRIRNAVPGFQLPVVFLRNGAIYRKEVATENWQWLEGDATGVVPDVKAAYFELIRTN